MRVLLDENLPHGLVALLSDVEADTVAGRGWPGTKNGELLRRASADYQAFLTMDRRLPDQQPVRDLPFAVVLLSAPTNRMAHLLPLVGEARYLLLGLSYRGRLVVVSHAETDDTIRIISARLATRAERRTYERA